MSTLKPDKCKSRGMLELQARIGDITGEIDRRIQLNQRVSILEVGCGHGVALLDLLARYGKRVSLYGISRTPEHGDSETMEAIALKRGLPFRDDDLPQMLYFDVCKPWPLQSGSFDIVFSQHAFLWFEDKIRPLEEINRVLNEDGIALLDLRVQPSNYMRKNPIIILDKDRIISFESYLQRFPGIRLKPSARSPYKRIRHWVRRHAGLPARQERPCLEMRKTHRLDFELEFVSASSFAMFYPKRKGWQSVYRCKKSA